MERNDKDMYIDDDNLSRRLIWHRMLAEPMMRKVNKTLFDTGLAVYIVNAARDSLKRVEKRLGGGSFQRCVLVST